MRLRNTMTSALLSRIKWWVARVPAGPDHEIDTARPFRMPRYVAREPQYSLHL
jgi:hypothetical protein